MNSHKKLWIVTLKQIGISQASRRLYGLIPRNKTTLKIGTGLSAGIFSFDSPHDRPYNEAELKEKYASRDELTWKERLNLMWRRDVYGRASPELETVQQAGTVALISGAVLGAFIDSRDVYMKFMAQNKQTMFKHPREAQAILQEQVTYHMMKGAIRMGIKLGIIVTLYFGACQSAHTIRNYINPLDHAASGFVFGATYRLIGGPKAMLAAGIIGGGMGLVDGVSTWALYKLKGETITDRWARELNEIHNNAAAKDEQIREERLLRRQDRISEEEWMQKQAEEQANEEKKGPPVIFKAIQFAKEVFGSSNIDIYHNIQDNSNATETNHSEEAVKKDSASDKL